MLRPVLIAAAGLVAGLVLARASGPGLTSDMILTALQSAHVSTQPGSEMDLLDRREGAAGWHRYKLDRFTIRASGGHFTIEGDATRLR